MPVPLHPACVQLALWRLVGWAHCSVVHSAGLVEGAAQTNQKMAQPWKATATACSITSKLLSYLHSGDMVCRGPGCPVQAGRMAYHHVTQPTSSRKACPPPKYWLEPRPWFMTSSPLLDIINSKKWSTLLQAKMGTWMKMLCRILQK